MTGREGGNDGERGAGGNDDEGKRKNGAWRIMRS